jgi:hypothetical protein
MTLKRAQAVRRQSLQRVLFRTIKNAKRSQDKAWSWLFTDSEDSTSSPKARSGASSFHGFEESQNGSRRQSLELVVFNDAEDITSGPKTWLQSSHFCVSIESPSDQKKKPVVVFVMLKSPSGQKTKLGTSRFS